MATITLRSTKGSPLTNNELDANFSNINTDLGTKITSTTALGLFSSANSYLTYNSTTGVFTANPPVTSVFGRTGAVALSSTDVTTALGYTPVNIAGDTLSGALQFPSGTVSAPSVAIGASNSGLYALSTSVLGLATAGAVGLVQDGAQNISSVGRAAFGGASLGASSNDALTFKGGSSTGYLWTATNNAGLFSASNGTGNGFYVGTTSNNAYIQTNNTVALTVDGNQNVGLGVTPSTWSQGKAIEVGALGNSIWGYAGEFRMMQNAYFNGAYTYASTNAALSYQLDASGFSWSVAPSGTAGTAITFTQAMTLDNSGNLLVGTTSASLSGATRNFALVSSGFPAAFQTTSSTAANEVFCLQHSATTGDNTFIVFKTDGGTGTGRGTITYNRSSGLTAYNTTSDYRAKEIIGPITNSGEVIDSLKVYEGVMKGATQSRPMLIAHEAQAVAPYCVTGEKDAVNEDGTPKFQQMDVSSLVPLLLAELQSLRGRVAALEAAVTLH